MTVKELWQLFALEVIDANTPPGHKKDLKLAFWCGCHGMFRMIRNMDVANEEAACDQLNDWDKELKAFVDRMREKGTV